MEIINICIKIPLPIARVCVMPVLLYRRLRYGYAFRKIQLSKGKYATVDNDDFDWLSRYKWHTLKCVCTFYAQKTIYKNGKTKTILMHREIMTAPTGLVVDHINHNGLDNRRRNLRIVTVAQNNWNSRRNISTDSSNYKGVSWSRNKCKWQAGISIDNKQKHLGYFEDEKEAAAAYDKAAEEHRGEFAVLNFP